MQPLLLHRTALWRLAILTPAILGTLTGVGAVLFVPVRFEGDIATCVLIPLLAVCTYTDCRWKIIPNFATYSALLWALTINMVASLSAQGLSPAVAETLGRHLGAIGLGASLLGAATCFAVMYCCYTARGFGGGDLKLAAALGALLGWHVGLSILFWCAVTAALFATASIVWRIGPLRLIGDLVHHVAFRLVPMYVAPPPARLEQLMHTPTPMALFFLIGTVLSLLGFTLL